MTTTEKTIRRIKPFDPVTAGRVETGPGYVPEPIFIPQEWRHALMANYAKTRTPAENERELGTAKIIMLRDAVVGVEQNAREGEALELDAATAAHLVAFSVARWHPEDERINAALAKVAEAKRLGISPRDLAKLDRVAPKNPPKPKSSYQGWLSNE